MRHRIALSLALLGLPLAAQDITGGLQTGLSLPVGDLKDKDGFGTNQFFGAHIGGHLDFNLNSHHQVRAQLTYHSLPGSGWGGFDDIRTTTRSCRSVPTGSTTSRAPTRAGTPSPAPPSTASRTTGINGNGFQRQRQPERQAGPPRRRRLHLQPDVLPGRHAEPGLRGQERQRRLRLRHRHLGPGERRVPVRPIGFLLLTKTGRDRGPFS